MGQAFDGGGNVLGEAFGNTKREVFDKLNEAHKDAAEIRIRSMKDQLARTESEGTSAAGEMPRYKSHKEVWALKIREVRQAPADQERQYAGGDWYLVPEDAGFAPIAVGHDEYYAKHKPTAGGYYVVYADGYKSFSPADAFEGGYTRVGA